MKRKHAFLLDATIPHKTPSSTPFVCLKPDGNIRTLFVPAPRAHNSNKSPWLRPGAPVSPRAAFATISLITPGSIEPRRSCQLRPGCSYTSRGHPRPLNDDVPAQLVIRGGRVSATQIRVRPTANGQRPAPRRVRGFETVSIRMGCPPFLVGRSDKIGELSRLDIS